jgi:putative SOS response-associated peptidase YedK
MQLPVLGSSIWGANSIPRANSPRQNAEANPRAYAAYGVPYTESRERCGHGGNPSEKVREGETENDIFAFLTTEPNTLIKAYHPKAMPVILTTQDEIDIWLGAPAPIALQLQRPLPDNALLAVARGAKQDGGAQASEPGMLV